MSDLPPDREAGSVPPNDAPSDDGAFDDGAFDDGAFDDGVVPPGAPEGAAAQHVLGAGAPGWAALARVLADEPPSERTPPVPATDRMPPGSDSGAARPGAEHADARRWLAAHPGEAARLAALDRIVGVAMTPHSPDAAPVDVEAALARVTARRLADEPAAARAPAAPSGQPVRRTPAPVWAAPQRASRWSRQRVASGVAAAAVLLAGVGLARWWSDRDGAPPRRGTGVTARHYATSIGQRDSVRLSDGTRVILGPASTLDVPAGYGTTTRTLALDGEAFFQVPHDSTRPFVVHAGPAAVHDLGTAFTVRRDAPDRVAVAVTEGVVRLTAASAAPPVTQPPTQRASGRPAPPPPRGGPDTVGIVLRAGQHGMVAPGSGSALTATRLPGSAATDTAWTSGRLVFRDAALPEVAGVLRRWHGVELRIADPALADRHLTATFRGEPLGDVLRVVGLALGARLDRRGDTVFVHRAP